MAADTAELVDRAQAADVGVILDRDMAGEGDTVGEDRMVANDDVVRDVYVGHEQIAIADRGKQAAALRAAMNRHEFADRVAMTDTGFRSLAAIFLVLRRDTAGTIRIKRIPTRNRERAFEEDVRDQARARTDRDLIAHDAIGSDFSI